MNKSPNPQVSMTSLCCFRGRGQQESFSRRKLHSASGNMYSLCGRRHRGGVDALHFLGQGRNQPRTRLALCGNTYCAQPVCKQGSFALVCFDSRNSLTQARLWFVGFFDSLDPEPQRVQRGQKDQNISTHAVCPACSCSHPDNREAVTWLHPRKLACQRLEMCLKA